MLAYVKWGMLGLTLLLGLGVIFTLLKTRAASRRASARRPSGGLDFFDTGQDSYTPLSYSDYSFGEPFLTPRETPRQRRFTLRAACVLPAMLIASAGLTLLLFLDVFGFDDDQKEDASPSAPQGISLASRRVNLPVETFPSEVQTLETRYTYDPAGNLQTRTDANGSATTYAYDSFQRLTGLTYADRSAVTFAYDGAGLRTQMTDALGTTVYSYDIHGRLIQITDPGGYTLQYTYEPRGYLASLSDSAGRTVQYEWNPDGQLITLDDSAAGVTHYAYDLGGNLSERTLPNGIKTLYQYDAGNRLSMIRHSAADGSTLLEFAYQFDAMGNRTQVTRTAAGSAPQSTRYTYDALNRLASVTYPDGEAVTYEYDASGNRTAMTSTASGTTTYTYDPLGRLVSLDDAQGTTTFTYDNNGSLIQRQGPQGTTTYGWDAEGRLIQVNGGLHTVRFRYDGDGRRLSKEVDGQTTTYRQHGQLFPQVLAEQSGGQTALFLAGLSHAGEARGADLTYYLEDGLGSTAGLANAAGQLVALLDYDAFGAQRTPAGASASFGFAGEQLDAETGLTYLRGRYYDPVLGRFISADPHAFSIWDTQALNRYSYVKNNPVNFTDPSGLQDDFSLFSPPTYSLNLPYPFPPRAYADSVWSMLGVQPQSPDVTAENGGPAADPNVWFTGPADAQATPVPHAIGSAAGLPVPGNHLDAAQALTLAGLLQADYAANETANRDLIGLLADLNPNLALNPDWLLGQNSGLVFAGMTQDEVARTVVNRLTSPALPEVYQPIPANYGGISPSQAAAALSTMTDLTGATYDPQSGQVILIGRSDPDMPALNMDDLVVALRTIHSGEEPSVSIEPCHPGVQDNCLRVHYNGRFANPDAAGEQWVTFNASGELVETDPPVSQNTSFGWTVFEADRTLKTASMGQDNLTGQPFVTQVSGFVSELDLMTRQAQTDPNYTTATDDQCLIRSEADRTTPSSCHRMWFVPQEVVVRTSADGHSATFDPVTIWTEARFVRFDSSGQMVDVPGDDPAVQAFVDFFNLHYADFAREKPELARLVQLAKLSGLARWLDDQAIPVDLAWLDNYQTTFVETPLQTSAITAQSNVSPTQQLLLYGGVDLGKPNTYLPGGPEVEALTQQAMAARSSLDQAAWRFTEQGTDYSAAAVNTAKAPIVGGYQVAQQDVRQYWSGLVYPEFTRRYNSLDPGRGGPLGKGWSMQTSELTFRRVKSPDNPDFFSSQLVLEDAQGRRVFWRSDDGSFRPEGSRAALEVFGITTPDDPFTPRPLADEVQLKPGGAGKPIQMEDGSGRLVEGDSFGFALKQGDMTFAYNSSGQLIGQRNASGDTLTLTYDAQQRPTRIQFKSSQTPFKEGWITFSYAADTGLLNRVETSDGKTFVYTYQDGYLVQVGDGANTLFTYHYEPATGEDIPRRLTQIVDGSGRVLVDNAYDNLGRITQARRGLGLDAQYFETKDQDGNPLLGVTYTNAAGQQSTRLSDAERRLVEETDQWGNTVKFEYDPVTGALTSVTARDGKTTRFTYENGILTGIEAPDGSTSRFLGQTANGDPQAIVNLVDHIAWIDYDATGSVIDITTGYRLEEIRPDGTVVRQEVDPAQIAYGYDTQRRLAFVQLPGGPRVEYLRNEAGQLIGITQPGGAAIMPAIDEQNRMVSLKYGSNYQVEFEYTPSGNQLAEIRLPNGTFTYDYTQGLLTSATDANGHTFNYLYGPNGALEQVIDAANGRVLYRPDQHGTVTVQTPSGGALEYHYENGRLDKITIVAVPQHIYQNLSWLFKQPTLPLGIEMFVESKDMR